MKKSACHVIAVLASLSIWLAGCTASNPPRRQPVTPTRTHAIQIPWDAGSCRYDNSCPKRSGKPGRTRTNTSSSLNKPTVEKQTTRMPKTTAKPKSKPSTGTASTFDGNKAIEQLKDM